ncbi:MAG TPA: hypothetical protein VMW72_08905 [Sedimentisphaerales bacterium]|nr:hypothetical protein [Sedimentisphaerales bacterium]
MFEARFLHCAMLCIASVEMTMGHTTYLGTALAGAHLMNLDSRFRGNDKVR